MVKSAKAKYLTGLALVGMGGALGLLFFFAPDQYLFYPRCLFHSWTGLQCPGCGGLRATHCLMHGEIAAAFHFNPLLVLLLPVLGLLGLARTARALTGRDWLERMRQPFWLWIFLAMVVAFGIGRNLAWG